MMFPTIFKKKPKEDLPYSFEADKGKFKVEFKFEAEKSFMTNLFKQVVSKTPGVDNSTNFSSVGDKAWSVPKELRENVKFRLSKQLKLEEIFKEVKKDLPEFKAVFVGLTELVFVPLENEKYSILVVFSGLCVGDE